MCEKLQCIHIEARLLRCLTAVLAAFFMVFAVALITIGILCKTLWSDFFLVLNNSMSPIPVMLIIIGFILIGITVLGFYGTVQKSWFILVVYAILLALIIFVEVGAAITCGVYQSQLNSSVQIGLKDIMRNNPSAMDSIQNKYLCCGINSYDDYNGTVPNSCCPVSNQCTKVNAIQIGCFHLFVSAVRGQFGTAIGLIVAMIILETISIIGIARLYSLLRAEEKPA